MRQDQPGIRPGKIAARQGGQGLDQWNVDGGVEPGAAGVPQHRVAAEQLGVGLGGGEAGDIAGVAG